MNVGADLSFQRYGFWAKAIMTPLLVGVCVFFSMMAVLVSHDSELSCEPGGACAHIERYPFGIEHETLAKVARADVEWSPGGRAQALKLVLTHEDGSFTDYHGVGKNGERAERTARAINAFLDEPTSAKTFALREGSLPMAAFLALLALGALILVPTPFARIRIRRPAERMLVSIGRWPAPRRELELDPAEFSVRPFNNPVNGQPFFAVEAGGRELGMTFHTEAAARARADELNRV